MVSQYIILSLIITDHLKLWTIKKEQKKITIKYFSLWTRLKVTASILGKYFHFCAISKGSFPVPPSPIAVFAVTANGLKTNKLVDMELDMVADMEEVKVDKCHYLELP